MEGSVKMQNEIHPGNGTPAGTVDMSNKVKVYCWSVLGISLLAAVVRCAALSRELDREIGYFARGGFFHAVATALLVLGGLYALSSLFLIPAGVLPKRMSRGGKLSGFFASFTAGVFLCDLIFKISSFAGQIRSGELAQILDHFKNWKYYTSSADRTLRFSLILTVVGLLTCTVSALYFFMISLPRRSGQRLGLAGMCVIIRLLCGAALIYFDLNLGMNTPNKMILQIASVCAMLFLLAEIRFLIGGEYVRPRLYVASGLLAALFCIAGGLSCLWGYFTGPLSGFGYFAAEGFVLSSIGLCCFARVADYASVKADGAEEPKEAPAEDTAANDVTAGNENSGAAENGDGCAQPEEKTQDGTDGEEPSGESPADGGEAGN